MGPIEELLLLNKLRKAFQGDHVNTALLLEVLGSIARTGLPWATALLAGSGIQLGTGTSPLITVGLAVVVYAAMQIWSIWRKVADKPRATGTPPSA